jgi:ribosomal protein S18 acetylase RimI-like enzyme
MNDKRVLFGIENLVIWSHLLLALRYILASNLSTVKLSILNFHDMGTITNLNSQPTILLRFAPEYKNKFPKPAAFESNENVYFRLLAATDILSLHKMYRSLSEESKKFFRPTFFRKKSLQWLLANFALLISTINLIKMVLMRVFPRIIFTAVVALNDKNEVVAFAYLNIKQPLVDGKVSAGFAACVRDDYHCKGLGSKLTKFMIDMARRENVSEIVLWVSLKNVKAIGLYKKHGFEVAQLINKHNYMKMKLNLS